MVTVAQALLVSSGGIDGVDGGSSQTYFTNDLVIDVETFYYIYVLVLMSQ